MLRQIMLSLANNSQIAQIASRFEVTRAMMRRFVAGEELVDALHAIRTLNGEGLTATIDHLGENVTSEAEANAAARVYVESLERIHSQNLDSNVSVKLTQMGLDLGEQVCKANLERILVEARKHTSFVRFDMESSAYTERTLQIAYSMQDQGFDNCGVVIQAYLYRSTADINTLIDRAMRVRLCKGAYQEPASIAYPGKTDVDENYILLMERLLLHGDYPALATHDQRIIEHAIEFVRRHAITADRFEFQMLYGVRSALQRQLVAEGYNVRVYVPFGKDWYRYFMRRLAERPANLFFLLSNLVKR